MKEMIKPENLKHLYNIVDWLDLGLVIAIIWYYSRQDLSQLLSFDYQASFFGIFLLLASLAISITFVYLTVKMRKHGQVSKIRAIARLIWNGIWIPLDLFFLFSLFIF